MAFGSRVGKQGIDAGGGSGNAVLRENGLAADVLLRSAEDPQMNVRLRENTSRAVTHGACGGPSVRIDARVLVWGQDRFEHVEAALQGWLPERG